MSNKNYYGIQKSDYQTSLSHYKYIKRVKVNGKWRYYYDTKSFKRDVKDKLGYDEKEARDKAMTEHTKALEEYEKTKNADTIHKSSDKLLKSIAKYQETPLGKLEYMKAQIDSGSYAVRNMLQGVEQNVKKKLNVH